METRTLLQKSAVDLIIKNGLERTTIDAISKASDVSPRTFFNYFDSKEDAILGFYKEYNLPDIDNAMLTVGEKLNVSEMVVDLVLSLFNPIFADQRLHKKVIKLVRKYPQLLEKKVSHISRINQQVVDVARRIILKNNPDLDELIATTDAYIVTAICVCGVKTAMKECMSTKKSFSIISVKKRTMIIINNAVKVI